MENIIEEKISYIILDANFLLIPLQFKIDIYEDLVNLIPGRIRIVIISEVIAELKRKRNKENKIELTLLLTGSFNLLNQKMLENPDLFLKIEYSRT
ncbi:MAG: hypothetical protein GF364_19395, partial [Candidatus Lokiarchaeota archaeon]|nr:hypothetical protein [Candidatus Lokiarchaeota archaeon]